MLRYNISSQLKYAEIEYIFIVKYFAAKPTTDLKILRAYSK